MEMSAAPWRVGGSARAVRPLSSSSARSRRLGPPMSRRSAASRRSTTTARSGVRSRRTSRRTSSCASGRRWWRQIRPLRSGSRTRRWRKATASGWQRCRITFRNRALRAEADGRPRHAHLAQPGAIDALAGDERRAARGAALLPVRVGEAHPLVRDPVDVGRAVSHQPIAVAAQVRDPDVVAPDHEDVRLVRRVPEVL